VAQRKDFFDFKKIQTGPYFGFQQGRNIVLEIGAERRMKEIKWKSPNANAILLGVNYDYKAKILGADLGFWYRPNRLSFTFGGVVAGRSDFTRYMIGVSPTLGYKIWFLHAQIGYYFYPKSVLSSPTNNLFLSLRLVLTQKTKRKNN
jgi:hypothetical protein